MPQIRRAGERAQLREKPVNFRYLAGTVLVAGLIVSQTTAAADRADQQVSRLNPIIVTAARVPQLQSESLAATTVITREEIERLQPQSVQELLRWTPGISVTNQGGAGRLTSVFMRGTQSNHTLVLINGVR